jgi:hypothetical protein
MTGLDHSHSAAVDLAGNWLAQNPRDRLGSPIIPTLRERFGISLAEAIEACRLAAKIREADHGAS